MFSSHYRSFSCFFEANSIKTWVWVVRKSWGSGGGGAFIQAGTVGIQAAKMAAGLGAHVTILDVDMKRLRYVNDIMPPHVMTQYSNEYNIRKHVRTHDLIVGGVLIIVIVSRISTCC